MMPGVGSLPIHYPFVVMVSIGFGRPNASCLPESESYSLLSVCDASRFSRQISRIPWIPNDFSVSAC